MFVVWVILEIYVRFRFMFLKVFEGLWNGERSVVSWKSGCVRIMFEEGWSINSNLVEVCYSVVLVEWFLFLWN